MVGSSSRVRRILADFLNLCEVRLILPEHTREAIQVAKDAKTAFALLGAAGDFIHRVIGSKGRRSDEDRNAFWASVVSLMPRDLRQNRKVASAMRLLKVCACTASVCFHLKLWSIEPVCYRGIYRYHDGRRIINEAVRIRGDVEDRASGWQRIKTNGHRDKVDGAIIAEAWHSELLSSEDNQNKQTYAIYCGKCDDGNEEYDMHQRRAQHGSDKDALQRFKGSEFEAKLREATKTHSRPNGVGGSLKLLKKYKCECIKKRKSSECDCKICTLMDLLLRRWHSARHGWRTSWRKAADGTLQRPPPCQCSICSDDKQSAAYMQVMSM